jgi:hypothetical protein
VHSAVTSCYGWTYSTLSIQQKHEALQFNPSNPSPFYSFQWAQKNGVISSRVEQKHLDSRWSPTTLNRNCIQDLFFYSLSFSCCISLTGTGLQLFINKSFNFFLSCLQFDENFFRPWNDSVNCCCRDFVTNLVWFSVWAFWFEIEKQNVSQLITIAVQN